MGMVKDLAGFGLHHALAAIERMGPSVCCVVQSNCSAAQPSILVPWCCVACQTSFPWQSAPLSPCKRGASPPVTDPIARVLGEGAILNDDRAVADNLDDDAASSRLSDTQGVCEPNISYSQPDLPGTVAGDRAVVHGDLRGVYDGNGASAVLLPRREAVTAEYVILEGHRDSVGLYPRRLAVYNEGRKAQTLKIRIAEKLHPSMVTPFRVNPMAVTLKKAVAAILQRRSVLSGS